MTLYKTAWPLTLEDVYKDMTPLTLAIGPMGQSVGQFVIVDVRPAVDGDIYLSSLGMAQRGHGRATRNKGMTRIILRQVDQ